MAPRPAKRARPSPSASPDPLNLDERDHEHGESSASHLVSFLTGYADHHSSGSSSGDEEDADGFDIPSEDEDEDDIEDDRDGDDVDGTPTKRAKTGLVGSSTPNNRKTTPRKRKGSQIPTKGRGTTPRKTPNKRKLDPLEILERNILNQQGEGEDGPEGIIRITKSDRYFAFAARSSRTSGNSYSALAKPLSQIQYDQYTASSSTARAALCPPEKFQERYDQWDLELDQGFNLLFYGFGSKRTTINRFAERRLSKRGNVVVINGYFPGLGIRDILNSIEDNLSVPQGIKLSSSASTSTTIERSANRIYSYFLPPETIPSARKKDYPTAKNDLYLIVHNLDSPSLRKPITLSIFSLLASSPRIHIIATFDHLHTPLLFSPSLTNSPPHSYEPGGWDGNIPTSRGYNWIYHNLTTYAPYTTELSYLKLSASSALSLSSSHSGISEEGALQILKSVPPMAARLLKLLLVKQLQNLPPDPAHHVAYPLNQISPIFAVDNDILQSLAKEKFIAREEERYDALIGEYRDHGLVVEAALDSEGRTGRWIWVPLGKAAIERVLETMKEVEV
ncbi:uncharacterized protein I303_100783 [Kwoniella dejecticola CBS 10117]|uniref:Origin recognition complex subunit 2 n=1 Tax=Kwoniella dejecticola CBS 10117 TaxID=1296121 RepID=A0A1A6AFX2_9TREE|nr:uncharacterized protein I303_00785 [Kwoniella dejecticola CBS 10117]OBR88965.1 hypothetical protein I303_00785 [Kwoniella dejecticola CBS 10117]